jgi:hypothetical protein
VKFDVFALPPETVAYDEGTVLQFPVLTVDVDPPVGSLIITKAIFNCFFLFSLFLWYYF